jgi:radical SAM protein with 4Fe4S-binding SPASM domain
LNSFSINAEGDIYNCPVELNNPAFELGNIYQGLDDEEQDRLRGLY